MWRIKRSKRARQLTVVLIAALVAAVALTGCGKSNGKEAKEVVATYKDGQVTRGEYDKFVNSIMFFQPMYAQFAADPTFQEHMINQLVTFRVLGAQADEQVKLDAETKTKEQMQQLEAYFAQSGDNTAFENQLKVANLTKADLEQYIKQSMVVLSDSEKKVKDEDVKASYDSDVKEDRFTVATVSHVLVAFQYGEGKTRTKEEALARAQEVQGKLKATGDFATLTKDYSDDTASVPDAGKFVDADVNGWVANFKKAAIELPLNTISDPVETEYGYHVMRVEDRKVRTFDEVKEDLKAEVAEGKVMEFIEKTLPEYNVKIDSSKLPQDQASAEVPAPGSVPETPAPETPGTQTTPPADAGK